MWIERLDIHGFRRLAGFFVFAEGLTLVVGPNESGKSSLHEALVRALYGFSPGEMRKSRGVSAKDRRRPWNGDSYGLVATVHERDGGSLRVEWDFEIHAVTVYDGATGARLASEPPGPTLLHLGFEDFQQVCCLGQEQITAVSGTATLKNALEQAIMSAGGDVRADEAEDRMKAFLQKLGIRVDTYKATAAGALREAETTRDRLEKGLEELEVESEAIAELARQLEREQVRLEELVAKERTLRREQLRAETESLEARLDAAQRHAGAAARRPKEPVVLPESAVERVARLEAQLDDLARPIEALEGWAADSAAHVSGLETKEAQLVAAVNGLSAYANTDPSSEGDVRTAWAELGALTAPVAPEKEQVPLVIPAESGPVSLWARIRHFLWLGLVVLTLGLASLIRRWVGQRRRGLTQRAVEAALAEQRGATASRKAELERRLTESLDRAGVSPGTDLESRVHSYLIACQKHGDWTREQLDLEQLRRQLQEAREPARSLQQRQDERENLRGELFGLYERLGVSGVDFDEARTTVRGLRDQAVMDAQAIADADAATKALDAALAGMTLEALRNAAGAARRSFEEHVVVHGPLPQPDEGAVLSKIEGERERAHGRVVQLETQIREREQALRKPAELREDLEACTARIARVEQAREAVKIARETLADAAAETYRNFAPRLNAALEASLPRITDGRYRSATVDDNLDVRVVAPETGNQISVEELSRATKDQIFLVQRLEIARLLDPTTGSAPLLLDDPFAHFDDTRLRLGLEVISDVAAQRQVVLFSEETNLIELAQSVCGACAVIELPAPSERAA